MSQTGAIVLAAGRGTRMKSALPKVLHPVCGLPMVTHVLEAAQALEPGRVAVVVGHGGAQVRAALQESGAAFVEQPEMLGTADAVGRCKDAVAGCESIVVLNGDGPLVRGETLARLRDALGEAPMAFVTCRVDSAGALGRVGRDAAGQVTGVVEAVDWEGPEGPAEINAGQYAFDAEWLWANIGTVPVSPKGEYYLTQLAQIAHRQGRPAVTVEASRDEALGVDDRVKLAEAEGLMRSRVLERQMLAGVTIVDPATTYIDATVKMDADTTVWPNSHLLGSTVVGAGSVIGPGTTLRSARIGEECRVECSVVEDSSVGARSRVGPFAHIRAGAEIGEECELGNYAEVKNSVIGRGVKMHHFSYVGDADVGEGTNIAAGAITCNYDGVQKHRTTIGAGVFIGCDTMLVAPVTVGDGAMTAAGAVVTKDVAPGVRVAGVPAKPMAVAKKAKRKLKR